jgi:hypothetical protein
LPGTHLYFPVDCIIDDRENTNFGIIHGADPAPSCRVVREDGTPCHQIRPGVFNGPEWDGLRQALTGFVQLMGRADPITADWHYGVARMYNWAMRTAAIPLPHLVTEMGIAERVITNPADPANNTVIVNQVRSYIHFVIWAAFANGHCGTPLKWCDRSQFGSIFPHGQGDFRPEVYPDFSIEYAALVALLRPGGPLADFGRLGARLTGLAVTPGHGAAGTVRAFGLKARDNSLIVLWLFDDDLSNRLKRDYDWVDGNGKSHKKPANFSDIAAAHAHDVVDVPGLSPGSCYSSERYNTWDVAATVADGLFSTDAAGTLSLPVGAFPASTSRSNRVWDGADVLLVIRKTL